MKIPHNFKPPIVRKSENGISAFHSYDWYFRQMEGFLQDRRQIFPTPCAATKPIHTSNFHGLIYQKFATNQKDREILVVSEPVVLIRYQNLYDMEGAFMCDFPPKFLNQESRGIFVDRLNSLLSGKDITGCLPKHHASLINDAVGTDWTNYWDGNIFSMIRKANLIKHQNN